MACFNLDKNVKKSKNKFQISLIQGQKLFLDLERKHSLLNFSLKNTERRISKEGKSEAFSSWKVFLERVQNDIIEYWLEYIRRNKISQL